MCVFCRIHCFRECWEQVRQNHVLKNIECSINFKITLKIYSYPVNQLEIRIPSGSDNLGRSFSVEIKSKEYLDKISIYDDDHGVLIEGEFGELCYLSLHEDKLLEIQGSKGVFRIEISRSEIARLLNPEGYPEKGD